ncbi:MAG: insulinase family protein [Candidatus Aminicenantes bacterium]|nr:insulinase family protein [Candidatus Aminicenantes bacterium]
MKKNRIVISILALTLSACLWAQKGPKDPFQFAKLNQIKMPEVKQVTLKNGLKLFLVEDKSLPTIDMRGMIYSGSVYEPAEKAGLASITGEVLRSGGTQKLNGDQLDRELETMAAQIETGIDDESGYIQISLLKENLDRVLALTADILRRPVFAQEKIDLAKITQRTVISRRNDNIAAITNREFNKLIYGPQSPFSRQSEYATIDAISREDIVQFYKTHFHPNRMLLAVWGDFDARQMVKKIEALLGDWPAGSAQKPELPVVNYQFAKTVSHIQKTDVNQSNIMLGHIGGLMDSPDFPTLTIMNRILSFDRMFKIVRTDEGLAYSVWGDYGAGFRTPGVFSAGAQTKSESTVKAITLMLKEIKRISEQEVSDEELNRAKDQFFNSYVFLFQSKAQVIKRMLTYAYYGYPLDFAQQIFKKIETVSKDGILKAAQQYLKPDQLQILVVGKQEDFDQPLSSLGTVRDIDITIPVPKTDAGPAASAESLARGKAILEKAIQAMGGSDTIKAVKTTFSRGDMVTQGMTLPVEMIIAYPDRAKFTMDTPGGQIVMRVCNGKGKAQTPQGIFPLPEPQVKNMLENMMRDPVCVWQNLDKYQVQLVGEKKFYDQDAFDLLISGPVACHYLVDKKSLQIVGCQYQGMTQSGPAAMEEASSDFRLVDGILFSFKTMSKANGEVASEMNIKEMKVNVAISEADFKTE